MTSDRNSARAPLDAVVLGAGFGGLYMLYKLREMGLRALALEAGAGVGGAWYWNRYPGARCDVESLVYSYSFSPVIDREWKWSEVYSAQPEILKYLNFVCDRLELRKDIRFNSRVVKAVFDEAENLWTLTTEDGFTCRAHHFISAAGPISAPIMPNIPNREAFQGAFYHSALWPQQEPDFTGKRVGVIGTGSSGTQLIPRVAEQAKQLTVFLRTPNYYVPARNRPLTDADYARWRDIRDDTRRKNREGVIMGTGDIFMDLSLREARAKSGLEYTKEQRRELLERRWLNGGAIIPRAFSDIMTNKQVNDEISDFLRGKIGEVVKDPKVAEILTPRGYAYGTKRICVGTNYYETFNRPNVDVVDVKATPIESFTKKGVIVGGREIELDVIIAASGFDALTGALTAIDIRGVGGRSIKDVWAKGSPTYLGIGIHGFPNLHMIGGPGSPSVLANVVMLNEIQVEWIADLIGYMRAHGKTRIEPEAAAQTKWEKTVREAVLGTLFETADSWYVGANVPGKPRGILAYAGSYGGYIEMIRRIAGQDYPGFSLT